MTKCKLFFNTLLILLLTALSINPATAAFDPTTEKKVTAADGAAGDYFGYSVSIDGTRMAVGAFRHDSGQGAVYIYDFNGSDWDQIAKLTANDGAINDRFGSSVSLSGNRLAVGAHLDDIGGNINQGSAYVFDLSGAVATWNGSQQKLTASDGVADDYFGHSVSLSGNRLAVGAYWADIGANSDQGSAYVFDLSSGSWSETTKLTASDGASNDYFGNSVSLSGNRLAVGAWEANIGSNSGQGSAYVFDLSGGSWSETTKLTASDGASNDYFGNSVSLSGNRLAVGAWQANIGSNSGQGAAYIYDLSSGSWSETTKLTASDGAANDQFGVVSLSGNRLAVGAYWDDIGVNSEQGSAYVFDLSGGSWSQTTKLTAYDGAANDQFGGSVSLSGGRLAVGGLGADVSGNSNQGAAYVYSDTYTVTATAGANGTISPATQTVNHGDTTTFTVTPATGYTASVTGCGGTLSGTTYTTGAITADCTVTASFSLNSYTIGGNVSGLSGSVTLQNNGGDDITMTADGTFTFNTAIAHGGNYTVTVLTQPTGQTCTLANDSGTINAANVTNVQVTCSANTYTIGGSVSGLNGSITLQNNGGDDIAMTANGTFTFATAITHGGNYAVTVSSQPTGQTCTVSNDTGTATANVSNVQVTCTTNTYSIGGNVSGLSGSVTLQNNGGDDITMTADGTFTFNTAIAHGSNYAVTVSSQPTGQTCTVSNAGGTATANVTNVQVTCANTYTIAGTISGLSGTIVLQNNGSDNLTITADGSFTFPTGLLNGAAYNITILNPPAGQSCTISNGSGTVNGGNIGNIQIACRATVIAPVPTINAYGILLMLLAMLGVAWFGVRRS